MKDRPTLKEIAAEMGISVTRVKQLEQRALEKIRKRLIADPQVREYLLDCGVSF